MSDIRFNIRPFPRIAVYPTGWGGSLTFAQIMDDCSPLAVTLMRKRHIDNKDIPDALQRGFMVFWERLVKDPEMLAEESKYAVAFMVEANCHQNYWKRHSRHISLDGLESNDTDHPDEWMLTGFEANRTEQWAAWATAVDMRLDIERAFAQLVETYMMLADPESTRLLIALYYLTTQVELKDAALIANINHHYLLDSYVSIVRKDVQRVFGELYRPGMRWIEKYKRGHQEPALLVLERYADNPRMTYAIRSLLEEKSTTEARLSCPWPNYNRFRQRAKEALLKIYNCSA